MNKYYFIVLVIISMIWILNGLQPCKDKMYEWCVERCFNMGSFDICLCMKDCSIHLQN